MSDPSAPGTERSDECPKCGSDVKSLGDKGPYCSSRGWRSDDKPRLRADGSGEHPGLVTTFDATEVEVRDVHGEAEVVVHLPEHDDPFVLYYDLLGHLKETLADHPGVAYSGGDGA